LLDGTSFFVKLLNDSFISPFTHWVGAF
jgi:hypothetical protein